MEAEHIDRLEDFVDLVIQTVSHRSVSGERGLALPIVFYTVIWANALSDSDIGQLTRLSMCLII